MEIEDVIKIEDLQDLICNLKESMADTYCKINDTKAELTKYAKAAHTHSMNDITGLNNALSNKADKTTASSTRDGLMSINDKKKLDGLSNYTHPDSGVTAGTNYPDNQTTSFGGTFNIPKLTFNKYGHITASATSKVTLPSLGTTSTTAAKGDHTHSQYLTSQDISGKENISNKTSSWNSSPNHTRYPTEKLVKDGLDSKISKSSTAGLVKNDGTIDNKTYLTSQDISGKQDKSNIVTGWSSTLSDTKYPSEKLVKNNLDNKISKSSTVGLVKNDGTIDNKTYLTQQTLPTGSTSITGIVRLSNATNSDSESTAATSKAVNDLSISLNNTINNNAASYSILVSDTAGATNDTKKFTSPTSKSVVLYASVRKNKVTIHDGVVLFIANGVIYPRRILYNSTYGDYYAQLNITWGTKTTYDVFAHYVGDARYDSQNNVISGSYVHYTYCMDYCQIIRT